MSTLLRLLPPLFVIILIGRADACDLEITVRAHARSVIFGDPLYIEVKIVNRGASVVSAVPEYYHGDRFAFRIRDPQTGLQIVRHGHGTPAPNQFQPGEIVTFYQYVFLPGLHDPNRNDFWKSIRNGQSIQLWGSYPLSPKMAVSSDGQDITVNARADEELRTLQRWAWAEIERSGKGPVPSDFGLHLLRPLDHTQTLQLASQIQPGEIADLLFVTMRLQELYATPPESRAAGDKTLVEWLRNQPDIKREALIKETRNLTESYNMPTTMKALQTLLDNTWVE